MDLQMKIKIILLLFSTILTPVNSYAGINLKCIVDDLDYIITIDSINSESAVEKPNGDVIFEKIYRFSERHFEVVGGGGKMFIINRENLSLVVKQYKQETKNGKCQQYKVNQKI